MAESLTQDDRLIAISTPLGKDVVLLENFSASEAISQLFQIEANLLASRDNQAQVQPKKLLGQPVTVAVTLVDGNKRFFNGIVRRFLKSGVTERFATYRMEIVPTMWLMSLEADCRIFAHKTIPEVIETMLKAAGVKFKMNLIAKYEPLDYCVQYRETGLNFICRLMEDVGINYWFDHAEKEHTLILSDANSGHKDTPHLDKVYIESDQSVEDDSITEWEEQVDLVIGKWRLKDLNLEMPRDTMEVKADSKADTKPPAALEYFDYPGGYAKRFNDTAKRLEMIKDQGDKMVAIRAEESDTARITIQASSSCRGLVPGFKISVDTRTLQDVTGSFIVTGVQHTVRQSPDYTGSESGSGDYQNSFTCVPGVAVLRPPRETPKPVVMGLQNAVVVDENMKQSDEISPDKYGRVKVIFPWDSAGDAGAWLRVAQVRAGKSGGHFWLPRASDEVLVAFMEGDPDQPIVVGSVYNAQNMPPYAQPANKTQSGIKTRSSANGEAANYNELRFEDLKGSEEILLHAEKVLKVEVEADEFRTVGNERTTVVQKTDKRNNKEGDEKLHIEKGNWYIGVNKDLLTTVEEGDYELGVKKGHVLVGVDEGKYDLVVSKGDAKYNYTKGNVSVNIKEGSRDTKIGQGNDSLNIEMGNLNMKLGMGNISVKCDMGKVAIESMQGIELKCGQSSIKIDQTGIKIEGMMVSAEGKIQTEVKGLLMNVKASAILQAGGAITMIG